MTKAPQVNDPAIPATLTLIGTYATITAQAGQRVTGSAGVGLNLAASTTTAADVLYGLCYRSSPNGTLQFVGQFFEEFLGAQGYPAVVVVNHSATVQPGAGTWDFGFCAQVVNGVPALRAPVGEGWFVLTN